MSIKLSTIPVGNTNTGSIDVENKLMQLCSRPDPESVVNYGLTAFFS